MQGEANAATSQPRMLDTKVINEELATDPTIKELKQLVDRGRQQGRRGLVAGTEGVL